MLNFFKRKKVKVFFDELASSPIKDKYFVRTCQWRWLDKNSIVVTDKNQPRVITLDPWPQLVFLGATGEVTISEFVYHMSDMYSNNVPPELAQTILGEITTLII